ncbi:type III restriction endonuclease, partial [Tenacibaculum maritimum]
GGIIVEVTGLQKDTKVLSSNQKLDIVITIARQIADEISTKFGDYRGTKSFYREPIRKYFKDKKMNFSIAKGSDKETGKPTMRNDIDEKYFVDLDNADWYAYNENYGTSEEKFLVKYLCNNLDGLKEKFKDIYLLRNERFFKLFRFSDGKATEPDFVLFMNDKFSDKEVVYQLFIEPKGDHLLIHDELKEQFLMEIEKESVIELYQNQEYRLIGMPFYNKVNKEDEFETKLNTINV